MKILLLIAVFISGCGICEKKLTTPNVENSKIEIIKNIEDKIPSLSKNSKKELESILHRMDYSLRVSDSMYFNSVRSIKNEYYMDSDILECVKLLDDKVRNELSKGNRIEARNLILKSIKLLD